MPIQNEEELVHAITRMRAAGTDLAECELKSAAGGFPKTTAETLSAFANTRGGVIIFGITEGKGFHVEPSLDVKTVQAKMAQAARELVQPALPVDICILSFEGHPVLVTNVSELLPRLKPCFVKKYGQMNGSYIRTGDGDHKLTLYEIDRFIENQQGLARNDMAIVPDATMEDLDQELLNGWLSHARATSFDRMGNMSDQDLMANRRLIAIGDDGVARPTLAGLFAVGKYPQKYFPRLNVVFTSYPTSQKGETTTSGVRFLDTVNIDGPVTDMVLNTIRTVSRNMRHGAIMHGVLREDVPDYPLPAIREAIANALMHRDYSPQSWGTPVQVDMYPDRLEIINPGGLFGSLTVEELGTQGAIASRNQYLSRILEDVPYTDYDGTSGRVVENRGSGYPTIQSELAGALLGKPTLTSTLDQFVFGVRHRRMTQEEDSQYSRDNTREAILAYFSTHESATTSNLAKASGISAQTIRGYIRRLMDEGLVEGIGNPNSPKRRYRLVK